MAVVFNAPPGWPVPPQTWVPDEEWMPDPSWPQPPAGWSFWVTFAERHDISATFRDDVVTAVRTPVTYGSDRCSWLPEPSAVRRRRASALPADVLPRSETQDAVVRPVRAAGADRATRSSAKRTADVSGDPGASSASGSSEEAGHAASRATLKSVG